MSGRIRKIWPLLTGRARQRRPLPLRLWLILAVAAITGAGFLAQIGMTAVMSAWEQQAEETRLASIRQIIGTNAAQWRDPAWQRGASSVLAGLGTDLALYANHPGTASELVYASPGVSRFLDTTAGQRQADQVTDTQSYSARGSATTLPAFQRIVIPDASQHGGNSAPLAVAFLWFTAPPPGEPSGVLWPVVELGTFALTLAIVVWLIGQPVLRPLAEMSQAAEGIAGGDLEVELSPSPVREVAEVGAALEGMSGALRESLSRQAVLEEERRLFVGAIAHDLRTPLFMLRGYLKGLERGVAATPEKTTHYVEMCQTQADALERLIADLFAYTRMEYLEQEPEHTPLELEAVLRQAVGMAQPRALARGVTLALDGPRQPCPLLGDRHLLERAVENLLDNALRYTPEGGEIRVRWHQRDDTLVFTVEDTGPGIAPHDLPRLFTPLYRGETSRNRQTGGAGLGLTIAQRILRAHDGNLTAANHPSGGAVFTGLLPAASYHAQPAPDVLHSVSY